MAKAKRVVHSIRWNKKQKRWDHLVRKRLCCHSHFNDLQWNKKAFVSMIASWVNGEGLAQLKVYNKNRTISFERTYGKDPKPKGGRYQG